MDNKDKKIYNNIGNKLIAKIELLETMGVIDKKVKDDFIMNLQMLASFAGVNKK